MVAPGIYHVKARLVDLIGSSGIENATSAQPKNLASAPRLSPLRFFGGVAGDETSSSGQPEEIPCFRYPDCLSQLQVGRSVHDEATPIFP